ncbi:trichohyalin [Cyclospora cayetanensis]|uniref:Cilia- and flagella-associated protein 45 n=1 Tax=Cyclospora cayetanensis TaxID=88456 RepID=A0A6P6RWT9_9EIME|nr:trichohyalin [Cyclospora cayetanensis]
MAVSSATLSRVKALVLFCITGLDRLQYSASWAPQLFCLPQELRKRMLETDNQWKERGTCVQATACVSSSNSVLSKAQEAQEENRESVRDMNSILLTQAEEERERLEKELDAKIEEERLKATKTMEEREAARQDKLRLQETMIKQQIDERQKKRQLELEETKKERVLVLQQMEALKLEDELAKRQKEETARKMQIEINEHNRKILTEKRQREALDQLEEEKILQYDREKTEREREQEARRQEAEKAKQKGYAAICARQDKELERAAQLDALRARRAMEEQDRLERQREETERRKQKRINEELTRARIEQQREKMLRLVETVLAEKREFDRVAATQKQQALAERSKREAEKNKRLQHMRQLEKQIQARATELQKFKIQQHAELEALKQVEEENKRCIERARDRKLAELGKMDNAEKYIQQLLRVCNK